MREGSEMMLGSALLFAVLCARALPTPLPPTFAPSWSFAADLENAVPAPVTGEQPQPSGSGYLFELSSELAASAGGEGVSLAWARDSDRRR
jgi:hypothetical protein